MNTENAIASSTLSDKIANLMPGSDDRRMWRTMLAQALECISRADDATLIRAGQKSNEYEDLLQACATGHPGVHVTANANAGYREFCLRLARMDQDTRNHILGACATELRKS